MLIYEAEKGEEQNCWRVKHKIIGSYITRAQTQTQVCQLVGRCRMERFDVLLHLSEFY